MLKIDIITLFPDMFKGPFDMSILKKAREKGLVEINLHDLRQFGITERRTVDDRPYGGGAGMILRIDVIESAIKAVVGVKKSKGTKIVLMDAGGNNFTQSKAYEYSKLKQLVIICGHYEGIDHRVHENLVDEIVSVGDYVLTGGEIPAMAITDTVTRLIPGVIKAESLLEESHSMADLKTEYPQYTRPPVYSSTLTKKKLTVPEVLFTGNHKEIDKWRKKGNIV